MRLRTLPTGPVRRRRKIKTIRVLPTLITAGNLVCGVLAISYLLDAAALPGEASARLLERAAWLIFIGMFLDTLDGRIARMTGTTSDFGAQMDSLADVVTFGIAPAVLAKSFLTPAFPHITTRLVFGFALVYVLGAALRLARYNVESDRMAHSPVAHVTRIFRGLPSPAAAGVIASLVLLNHEYAVGEAIEWTILVATPILGVLMVSRMPYSHIVNRYLDAGRAQPLMIVLLMLLVYLVVAHFIETVAGLFLFYALSGPLLTTTHRWFGWPAWAEHEEEDEEPLVLPSGEDDDDGDGEEGDEGPQERAAES